jgi:hypothetical protein
VIASLTVLKSGIPVITVANFSSSCSPSSGIIVVSKSSAQDSKTNISNSSTSFQFKSTIISHFFQNIYETDPLSAKFHHFFETIVFTSVIVRFELSDNVEIITAIHQGQ